MGDATPDPVYNLETAPNSFPSWQFIPPNSGPLPPNTKVITTTHTGEAMDDLDIVDRLIQERDEARREVCMILAGKGGKSSYASPDAIHIAEERGWDCFKDDTDG